MSELEPMLCSHQWLRIDSGPRSFLQCALCGLEDSVKRLGVLDPDDLAPPDEALIVRDEAIADLQAQLDAQASELREAYRKLSLERDRVAHLIGALGAAERRASAPSPAIAPPVPKPAQPKPPYRWGLLL